MVCIRTIIADDLHSAISGAVPDWKNARALSATHFTGADELNDSTADQGDAESKQRVRHGDAMPAVNVEPATPADPEIDELMDVGSKHLSQLKHTWPHIPHLHIPHLHLIHRHHRHHPHSHHPHSHTPHSHSPHSHTPHSHSPHSHSPHSHSPHSHTPHSHSPHSHHKHSPGRRTATDDDGRG